MVNHEYDIECQAVMLKKKVFKEHDLMVTLLMESEGIVTTIAFGAAASHSSRGRCCQSFRPLLVHVKKKVDYPTHQAYYRLVALQELSPIPLLSTSLNRSSDDKLMPLSLACGYYINECYLHLANQFEIPEKGYQLYINTLQCLQNTTDKLMIHRTLRFFEMEILCYLGYDIREFNPLLLHEPMTDTNTFYYDLHRGWQVNGTDGRDQSTLDKQVCECLHDLSVLNFLQLKQLQQHNQRLLDELSHFKIQSTRDWLKNYYVSSL